MATRGPGTYKIPAAGDAPVDFRVALLKGVEWEHLRTVQRSRGVGEPPLFLGSAVFWALRDALKAARAEWGVGVGEGGKGIKADDVLRLQSPATPERVRVSCVDPIVRRARVEPEEGEKSFFLAI